MGKILVVSKQVKEGVFLLLNVVYIHLYPTGF